MAEHPETTPPVTVPRGRHAPPLAVRVGVQRHRLFQAAAVVFARVGYAEASAEAISREAGMSKATFYEHFSNKEECLLALFDEAATEVVREMGNAISDQGQGDNYEDRVRSGIRAFLTTLAAYPNSAHTLLISVLGAGPRAIQRRDTIMALFADGLYRDNARTAPKMGAPTFASRDDAFACIGAITELIARQLRVGSPEELPALEPVLMRVVLGVLSQNKA